MSPVEVRLKVGSEIRNLNDLFGTNRCSDCPAKFQRWLDELKKLSFDEALQFFAMTENAPKIRDVYVKFKSAMHCLRCTAMGSMQTSGRMMITCGSCNRNTSSENQIESVRLLLRYLFGEEHFRMYPPVPLRIRGPKKKRKGCEPAMALSYPHPRPLLPADHPPDDAERSAQDAKMAKTIKQLKDRIFVMEVAQSSRSTTEQKLVKRLERLEEENWEQRQQIKALEARLPEAKAATSEDPALPYSRRSTGDLS